VRFIIQGPAVATYTYEGGKVMTVKLPHGGVLERHGEDYVEPPKMGGFSCTAEDMSCGPRVRPLEVGRNGWKVVTGHCPKCGRSSWPRKAEQVSGWCCTRCDRPVPVDSFGRPVRR